jgi:hypothetical protein
MNVADQLFLFKNGLQQQIQREVNIQQPKTLAEAMSYAQRAEITLRNYNPQRNNNNMNYRNNIPRYHSFTSNTNNSSTSVPMELSNINAEYYNNTHYIAADFDSNNYNYNEYTDESYTENKNDSIPYEQLSNEQQNLNAIQYNNRNNYPNKYSNSNTGTNNNFRISGLTREQIENCKRTGSCFYCNQRGHMKSQCPKLMNKLNNINTNQQYTSNNSNPKK